MDTNCFPLLKIELYLPPMPNFNNSLSSKLPKIGTSIFTVMSSLANEEGALNMSQGFPDFDVDPKLIDLVTKNMPPAIERVAVACLVFLFYHFYAQTNNLLFISVYYFQPSSLCTYRRQ